MSDARVRIMKYYELLRGDVDSTRYIETLTLIKKVNEKAGKKLSEEAAYRLAMETAAEMGIALPYTSSKAFYATYLRTEELNLGWNDILATVEGKFEMRVPLALVKKFEEIIPDQPSRILIPEAEKFAPYLDGLLKKYPDHRFVLTSMNNLYFNILNELASEYSNTEVIQGSIYEYGFLTEKFDIVLAVPMFGGRDLGEEGKFICREYDLMATENLLLHLTGGGRLGIVLPAKITFGSGRVSELRQFIQSMYRIEEISELPTGIFLGYSGIKCYYFTIGTGRTDDVVIRRYKSDVADLRKQEAMELIPEEDTFVMSEELQDMGDWSLNRIFASQDADWQNYQNSSSRKIQLGEVAQIFKGKAVNRKDENGNIGVVNISNVQENRIDYDGLDHLQEEERKVGNFLLQDGDLLIPARGTAIRVGLFEEQTYPCIASANLIVIRPDQKNINSVYLKIFLDSPIGKKLLTAMQQGTTVINISHKDLVALEVPIPPFSEQEQMAFEYKEELNRYLSAVLEAEQRWTNVKDRLIKKI